MDVILEGSVDADQLDGYAGALSQLPHVVAVKLGTSKLCRRATHWRKAGARREWRLSTVLPDVDPYSDAAHLLLDQVRQTPSPDTVHVGGLTAENFDTKDALFERVPLAAALLVLAMFGVLFAFTGSVVLPIKALLLNVVSLSATLGAMVFIFQEGHLKPGSTCVTNVEGSVIGELLKAVLCRR